MTIPTRLPLSFAASGFVTPELARRGGKRFRRLMMRTEGIADSGKTEFLLTCPGPGEVLCLDRGFDAVFDNPRPPPTRRTDFGFKVVTVPTATQFASAKDYVPYWAIAHQSYLDALTNPDSRTVCIDGDNLGWDLQRLAEHGKLTGIFPATRYTDVYAARRAYYFRAWDSGKIILATNWMRDEYAVMHDTKGAVLLDEKGEPKKEKTGNKASSGFPDHDYLWQICLRHLYIPPQWNKILKRNLPPKWGLLITKCKADPMLVGTELWGGDATFTGLVQTVYPQIPLSEWGLS